MRAIHNRPHATLRFAMSTLILLGIGLAAGVLSGMFGIGGGIIIIPALLYLVKLKEVQAIGTSLAALIPPVGLLQCNCSVIGDEKTHEAMVIDPGDDINDVLALVRKHNLQVKQIVITHAPIDHVGGAMKLRAATGAPILLNQNDYALLKMLDAQAAWIGMRDPGKVEIDHSVTTGETVTAGSLSASILHTPGHTEGSICLYFP